MNDWEKGPSAHGQKRTVYSESVAWTQKAGLRRLFGHLGLRLQEPNVGCVTQVPPFHVCRHVAFFKINLFIYLFIYGCVGSSFLCEGFL